MQLNSNFKFRLLIHFEDKLVSFCLKYFYLCFNTTGKFFNKTSIIANYSPVGWNFLAPSALSSSVYSEQILKKMPVVIGHA